MGCASSTEVVSDPSTGKQKTKKTLGGNYPGNRPPQHAVYKPNDFDQNGQAVAHFVAYGGGNALTLQTGNKPNNNHNYGNSKPPEYIQVTLPAGVVAGQTIHVQAPDGRLNAIVIPPGYGAGSTFTVEFTTAPDPAMSYNKPPQTPQPYVPQQQPYYAPQQPQLPTVQASVYNGVSTSSYQAPTSTNATAIPYNPYAHNTTSATYQQHEPQNYNNGRNNNQQQDDGFASGFGR